MLRKLVTVIMVACLLALVGGCAAKTDRAAANTKGLNETASPGRTLRTPQDQLSINKEIDNQVTSIDNSLQSLDNALNSADKALTN